MKSTTTTLDGRSARMSRALDQRGVSERLAQQSRRAAELEDDARHWSDRGHAAFAAGCAAEAAAIRREISMLSAVKFSERAQPKTVTFERDPGRVAQSVARLDKAVLSLDDTVPGFQWLGRVLLEKWMQALDDLLALGRRKADRKPQRQPTRLGGSFRNSGTRIH